ncbi:SCP2 sterol-binding domain-containing protein [bacterium]|nr:SCP2 sterol-binding domain-containing protein [bacterium]
MKINLPNDITPKDFFNIFLPEQFQNLKNEITLPPFIFDIGVEISGQGGGYWTLSYNNQNFSVLDGVPDEPFLSVCFDIELWDRFFKLVKNSYFFDFSPLNSELFRKKMTQDKINKLKKEHGAIDIIVNEFEYDNNIHSFNFQIKIGDPLDRDPLITINLSHDDIKNLEKEKNIISLITSKKLNIDGDLRYLMKIASLVILN